MSDPKIVGLIRHVLTLVGGLLVSIGWLSENDYNALFEAIMGIAGSVAVIVALVMSWTAKEKQVK